MTIVLRGKNHHTFLDGAELRDGAGPNFCIMNLLHGPWAERFRCPWEVGTENGSNAAYHRPAS